MSTDSKFGPDWEPYTPDTKSSQTTKSTKTSSNKFGPDWEPYTPPKTENQTSAQQLGPKQGFGDFLLGAGIGGVKGMDLISPLYQMFRHPIDTAVGLKNLESQTYQQAVENYKQGNYGEAANQAANLLLPGVGQQIDVMRQKAQAGDVKGAGEELGNLFTSFEVAPGAYGKALKYGLSKTISTPGDILKAAKGPEIAQQESQKFAKYHTSGTSTPELLDQASTKAKVNSLNLQQEAQSNAKYLADQVETNAPRSEYRAVETGEVDPVTNKPKVKLYNIRNPIEVSSSLDEAQNTLKAIKKQLPNADIVSGPLNRLRDTLNVVNKAHEAVSGKRLVEFDRLDALHDKISDILSDKQNISAQYGGKADEVIESLERLNKGLDTDIRNGLGNWKGDTLSAYEASKQSRLARANAVNPEMTQNLLKLGADPDVTYKSVAKGALNSPETVKQFKNITGDSDIMSTLAMRNLIETSSKADRFDATSALDKLTKNTDLYREALGPDKLDTTQKFLDKMSQMQNQTSSKFSKALVNYSGKIALTNILGSAAKSIFTGSPGPLLKAGAGALGAGGILTINKGLDLAMKNPTVMNAMLAMSELPKNSTKLPALQRIVTNGLKGTAGLKFVDAQNQPHDAEIDNEGKVQVY